MLSRAIVGRSILRQGNALASRRYFADASVAHVIRPVRRTVTPEERQALRRARKEQAAKMLQQGGAAGESTQGSSSASSSAAVHLSSKHSRWVWYIGVSVPTAILIWGFNDEKSPPAKLSEMIGLTSLIRNFSEDFARPSHDKLLPDWSQVRQNTPEGIQVAS
jgi:hypothetical protein